MRRVTSPRFIRPCSRTCTVRGLLEFCPCSSRISSTIGTKASIWSCVRRSAFTSERSCSRRRAVSQALRRASTNASCRADSAVSPVVSLCSPVTSNSIVADCAPAAVAYANTRTHPRVFTGIPLLRLISRVVDGRDLTAEGPSTRHPRRDGHTARTVATGPR